MTRLALTLLLLALPACQSLDNAATEAQMYENEWLNGLPTHHGHLKDGEPYEDAPSVSAQYARPSDSAPAWLRPYYDPQLTRDLNR